MVHLYRRIAWVLNTWTTGLFLVFFLLSFSLLKLSLTRGIELLERRVPCHFGVPYWQIQLHPFNNWRIYPTLISSRLSQKLWVLSPLGFPRLSKLSKQSGDYIPYSFGNAKQPGLSRLKDAPSENPCCDRGGSSFWQDIFLNDGAL